MSVRSKYAGVHIPSGCTVYVGDSLETLEDVGVIPADQDSNIQITYDDHVVQGSKLEEVLHYFSNMKATGSTALYQINLERLNKLFGGMMSISKQAGTPVSGETFSIGAGFSLKRAYVLPGQNSDGSAPTVASVKSGSTALVEGTDYTLVQTSQGWGVMVLSADKAPSGRAVTVTYGYTPAAYVQADMGSGSVAVSPKIIRFEKRQDGKLFQVTLWSAMATNGLQIGFPGASADNPTSVPIEITGQLDPGRDDNKQLVTIHDEIGVE